MSVPRTKLHNFRLADQVRQNLVGVQHDMRQNAAAHKAMAQAQSPNIATLQQFISDCVTQYQRRLTWVSDLRADAVKWQRVLDAMAVWGWTEADIQDVYTPLRNASIALRDAPKTTYAEIITACDNVLSSVNAPDTLWPE